MHRKDSDQPRGVHLWLILWKAFAALQHHALKSIERLGLGYSDFGVLEVLLHKGPTPVNTIGEKVNLTSGSISVAGERLGGGGAGERRAAPAGPAGSGSSLRGAGA